MPSSPVPPSGLARLEHRFYARVPCPRWRDHCRKLEAERHHGPHRFPGELGVPRSTLAPFPAPFQPGLLQFTTARDASRGVITADASDLPPTSCPRLPVSVPLSSRRLHALFFMPYPTFPSCPLPVPCPVPVPHRDPPPQATGPYSILSRACRAASLTSRSLSRRRSRSRCTASEAPTLPSLRAASALLAAEREPSSLILRAVNPASP